MKENSTLKGFTLVEMLVSISIIALISTVFLSYSRSQESVNFLNRFSQKLMNDLKEARNNALNMKDLTDPFTNKFIYCGWGVHFDKNNNEYFLFKDKCLSGKNEGNNQYGSEDIKFSSFKIGQGVSLETNINDLVFLPPQPKVCVNRNCNPSSQEILLKTSSFTTKIIINPIGLIYFE